MATSRPTGNLLDIVARQSKDIRRLKARLNGVGGGGADVPLGSVLPYAGSSAPDKFLICDGSAVSRTTYADLFNVVGETFGAGDGSTTFNLPDLREKFPVGANDVGGDYDLADTGGAEEVTLTEAEMPSHDHSVGTHIHGMPSHSHGAGSLATGSDTHSHGISAAIGPVAASPLTWVEAGDDPGSGRGSVNTASDGHSHGISGNTSSVDPGNTHAGTPNNTDSAGSDQAHENRPPFVALNFIIRAE